MAGKKKEADGEKKGKPLSDRKRMAYVRIRYAELRKEVAAMKKELSELRQKLSAGKKAKGNAGAEAADDDD